YRVVGNESAWTRARGGGPRHSFLEGPSFDRDGNLYCVDLAHGRLFRISPDAEWQLFAAHQGQPNGLRTTNVAYGGPDRQTLFITECEHGVILTARLEVPRQRMYSHS